MKYAMEIFPPDASSRKKLCENLWLCGYPIAESTLTSMASRGNGPLFSEFSCRAVHRWDDALYWRGRLTAPFHLTSERPHRETGRMSHVQPGFLVAIKRKNSVASSRLPA